MRVLEALFIVSSIAAGQTMAAEQAADARFPKAGEWGCYRRDGSQQARSPLKGRITEPKVAWKHFVGVVETLVEVTPDEKDTTVSVPREELADASAILNDQRWGLLPPLGMIEGRMQPMHKGGSSVYADVLPDVPGLERIEFESGFRASGTNAQWPPSRGWLKAWKDGKWETVWEMPPYDMLFSANPIVGDFDGDGKPEIAFIPWRDLVILDALTGAIKDKLRFTKGRSYGFLGVYDMNGDGKQEFLVMADFTKHIDVLGYRDGQLAVLWQMPIEDIGNPQIMMRVNIDPAADVDGDGKLEVMLNLQNAKGDGRWWVTVRDGMTGEVKAEIADARLLGIADVNGDGDAELLTIETKGALIPDYGTIRIWSVRGGKPSAIWESADAAWQTWSRPMPGHVNTGATFGRLDVLWQKTGTLPVVAIRRPVKGKPGVVAVSAEQWKDGALRPLATATGPGIEARALDENGSMLLACRTAPDDPAELAVSTGRAAPLVSYRKGVPRATPMVAQGSHLGRPVIVAGGYGEEVVAFEAPLDNRPARELWRVHGRAQSESGNGARGPVLADLAGDGNRQLICATAAPEGWGRLVVMGFDGKELWHHDVPRVRAGPPRWNTGGLILWQVGHFTDKNRMDVLLTVRRSLMGSEETMLLSGKDGSQLWRRDRVHNRSLGGIPFALADCNGDGLDDVIGLNPNVFHFLQGSTGEDLLVDEICYWGVAVAGDFLNNGTTTTFFGTTRGAATGVLTTNDAGGVWVWCEEFDTSPRTMPAFGDFTGSGRMQAVGIGYRDGIRCYDTATGNVLWRMPMPAKGRVTDTPASGDVDSDGRDEALFVIGKTLHCLGTDKEGKQGVVKWKLDLPVAVGAPVIADADGDGLAEILVTGADGFVYCVK